MLYIFILNHTVTDFILSAMVSARFLMIKFGYRNDMGCAVLLWLRFMFRNESLTTILLVSFERWVHATDYLDYTRWLNPRSSLALIVMSWVIWAIYTSLLASMSAAEGNIHYLACTFAELQGMDKTMSTVGVCMVLIISIGFTAFHVSSFRNFRQNYKALMSGMVNDLNYVSGTFQFNQNQQDVFNIEARMQENQHEIVLHSRKKSMETMIRTSRGLVAMTVVHVLQVVPAYINMLFLIHARSEIAATVYLRFLHFLLAVLFLSSAINIMFYIKFVPELSREVKTMFCCRNIRMGNRTAPIEMSPSRIATVGNRIEGI